MAGPHPTIPRISCRTCRDFVANAGPIIARALERRAAYRAHGRESARAAFESMVRADVGWETLRGRGARRARLRRYVNEIQRERPELFDLGYRRFSDTARLKMLQLLLQELITHLRDVPHRWHHVHEGPLPEWARTAFNEVPATVFSEQGQRWVMARHAAADRIIARLIRIAPKTVKRLRRSRYVWVPVEAAEQQAG